MKKNISIYVPMAFLMLLFWATASYAQTHVFPYQIGDSVRVNPDSSYYMTGEKISPWVYQVNHAIKQIDSEYHPEGVLLYGIESWVYQTAILPADYVKKEALNATQTAPVAADKEVTSTQQTQVAPTAQPAEEEKETVEQPMTTVAESTSVVEEEPVKEEVVEQPVAVVAPKKEEPKKIVSAPASTSSEAVSIMGTVVEQATGFPIIGANIIQKGTSNGTITDFDGNFVLSVPNGTIL